MSREIDTVTSVLAETKRSGRNTAFLSGIQRLQLKELSGDRIFIQHTGLRVTVFSNKAISTWTAKGNAAEVSSSTYEMVIRSYD